MKRALLIVPDFPPRNIVSVRRAAGTAKYLPCYGWDVTVLTSLHVGAKHLMSPEEVKAMVGDHACQVIRVMGPERRVTTKSRILTKTLALAGILCMPGTSGRRWARVAARELLSAPPNTDVIWASGPPWSTFLAGSRLSGELSVPWVADHRDVLADLSRNCLASRLLAWRETRLCKGAAHITTLTEGQAEMLRRRHAAPVTVVPNGYDPEWLCETALKPDDRVFRIVHTGNVWGGRSPQAVLEAVNELIAQGNIPDAEIELEFYGGGFSVGASGSGKPLRKMPRFMPKLPPSEIARVQREATVLLNLGIPEAHGHVTAKIFEYMAAGRPVLTYPRDHDSDGHDHILRTTGIGVACDSVDELRDVIRRWYHEWKQSGDVGTHRNLDEIRKWSRREHTRILASVLDTVVAEHRG